MSELQYFIHDDFLIFREFFLRESPTIMNYKKNTYINNTSDNLDQIYFILDGRVINIFITENGNEKAFMAHGRNTIAPLYSPGYFPIEASITLKALEDTNVLAFSKSKFGDLIEKNEDLNNQLYLSNINFINALIYENISLANDTGLKRICYFFVSCLKEHHPKNNIIKISQKELANLVGLNQINTSRNIKILKDMNMVSTGRNKVTIINIEQLTEFLKQN